MSCKWQVRDHFTGCNRLYWRAEAGSKFGHFGGVKVANIYYSNQNTHTNTYAPIVVALSPPVCAVGCVLFFIFPYNNKIIATTSDRSSSIAAALLRCRPNVRSRFKRCVCALKLASPKPVAVSQSIRFEWNARGTRLRSPVVNSSVSPIFDTFPSARSSFSRCT